MKQLKEDFYNKCYICELKDLSDPQVEHLKPHHGRTLLDRIFDCNNLFYVCPHCNNFKKKYDDKIINCCIEDPEDLFIQSFENGHVKVYSLADNENANLTAELIQESFEKQNTGIRIIACQHRIEQLSVSMNILYKKLNEHRKHPEEKRHMRSLKSMLSRQSSFAAFKRNYVREHIDDYPDLEEFLK